MGMRKVFKRFILVFILVCVFVGVGVGNEKFENPEDVVRAFIFQRAKFSFFMKDKEYTNYCKKTITFILDGERYFDEYCGGGVPIIKDFSIIHSSIKNNYAEVIVKHNFCGVCANDLSCSYDEESKKGVYKLIKKDGSWRITEWYTDACPFPCDGWIFVEEVLRMYDFILKNYSKFKYLGNKEEIKQLILKFKKCMEVKQDESTLVR